MLSTATHRAKPLLAERRVCDPMVEEAGQKNFLAIYLL